MWSFPDAFTQDYLADKTFYLVYWETEDADGNPTVPHGAVRELGFRGDSNLDVRVLRTGESFTLPWAVGGSGLFYTDGDLSNGSLIACEHAPAYLRAHWTDEDGFGNVELWFFSRDEALAYARTMTGSPPPCAAGPGFVETPAADIDIDGFRGDWEGIDPVLTDPLGDWRVILGQ